MKFDLRRNFLQVRNILRERLHRGESSGLKVKFLEVKDDNDVWPSPQFYVPIDEDWFHDKMQGEGKTESVVPDGTPAEAIVKTSIDQVIFHSRFTIGLIVDEDEPALELTSMACLEFSDVIDMGLLAAARDCSGDFAYHYAVFVIDDLDHAPDSGIIDKRLVNEQLAEEAASETQEAEAKMSAFSPLHVDFID